MARKKSATKKNKTTKKTASPKKALKKTAAKKASKPKIKGLKKLGSAKKAGKSAAKTKVAPKKAVATQKTAAPKKLEKKPSVVAKKVDFSQMMTPLDDRILVQISGAEKKTPGGLYIPDTVADTSGNLEGVVVAVGRGRMNKKGHVRPMDVKVGDRVVFAEYSGSKIKLHNEDLVFLREEDVMGIISK